MSGFLFLLYREWVRFYRQRSRVFASLFTPIFFWALMASGMKYLSFSGGETGGTFFLPGALALSVLFTSIFSTISVIEDRNEGFLQGVVVSPLSRFSIVSAKVFGGTFLALIQTLLIALIASFFGSALSASAWIFLALALFLMGFAYTALGFFFAWKLNSSQGFHGIMNMVLFPSWFLSGAFFPIDTASTGMKWLMSLNPLTYALQLVKGSLQGNFLFLEFVVTLGFGLLLFSASVFLVNSTERK